MLDPSDAEDLSLVRQFLAGEQSAFETLFNKYRDKVYRLCYRFVRNKEDALELSQEVFIRVYQNLSKFKTDSKFFTWLYRVAVNRSIDFERSRRARPAFEVDNSVLEAQESLSGLRHPSQESASQDPVAQAQHKELEEKLAKAVNCLSEKHRMVFLLHAQEDLSYKEIAKVMECSLGTVMSRLFYARKKLQELLAGLGLERPGRRWK